MKIDSHESKWQAFLSDVKSNRCVMPGMQPKAFLDNFVYPDFEEWRKNQTDLRRCFHLANSTYAMTEHFYQFHKTKGNKRLECRFAEITDFRTHMEGVVPGFLEIHTMTNAFKHYRLKSGRHSIDTTGAIVLHGIDYSNRTIGHDYSDIDCHRRIVTERRDGTIVVVGDILERLVSYWQEILESDS